MGLISLLEPMASFDSEHDRKARTAADRGEIASHPALVVLRTGDSVGVVIKIFHLNRPLGPKSR